MAIYVRNQDGEMEPYKIVGLKGEDGVTPNISIGTVTTLEAGEEATVTREGTNENPIFNFGIPKGESGDSSSSNNASIDDNTISTDKTWSSAKIEDFVLTNVGTIWKDVNGGQVVIDSTMDGFLREVEILGNTTQNQDDLSNIQHLGVWNEEKQGYEIEIVVSNSSSKDDLNYQEFRTTILLSCQLMKLGNISDRLYWDSSKGRYVVEKKVDIKNINKTNTPVISFLEPNRVPGFTVFPIHYTSLGIELASNIILCNKFKIINHGYSGRIPGEWISYHNGYIVIQIDNNSLGSLDRNGLAEWLGDEGIAIYFASKKSEFVKTDIREELKLPTFINNTYITVNGGIQGSIKAKAPVDGGKVIGVLQEENIKLKETNNIQDELINTTMLATDEMHMMLEPLLANMLIDSKTISPLVNMYVAMIKREIKTIEQVPEKYREQVDNIINNK